MEEVDILIIGAGVVGLAIAREAAKAGRSVVVLERNAAFGQETSSRNSEVIHGGMYYPTGTFKARFCVEGRHLLYELCEKYSIAHKKIGKVVIAVDKDEKDALQKLCALGKANGVEDLTMLTVDQIKKIEPNVAGLFAMYSPQTGIIDSHNLMKFYLNSAHDNGAMAVFNATVTSIEKIKNGYMVNVKNSGETINVVAKIVINSAGLDSDSVAAMSGIDLDKNKYRLHYCKGQYFRVSGTKSQAINGLVYPVPKPKAGGLGIHATIDLTGSIRLGPDDEYIQDRVKDYSIDSSRAGKFLESAKTFMPFIELKDLTADTSGIRPKLQESGGEFRDFVIRDEAEKGLPGFINLIGIESPGLTASPAIAKYVDGLIRIIFD
jgi:L-2-hydroxyglutarate oxidase LhgO